MRFSYRLSATLTRCVWFARVVLVACPVLLLMSGRAFSQSQQPYTIHVLASAVMPDRQLESARASYYAALQGDDAAGLRARDQFSRLLAARPNEAGLRAYQGSLDLLEAANTWAFWKKRQLAQQGLKEMDEAVEASPNDLEARFVRALSTWHLPFFFHRRAQSESDLLFLGPRAEAAARSGQLPPPLAAAALDYWGQVLSDRKQTAQARAAYQAAIRVAPGSPGGKDAQKRLNG